MHTLHQSEYQHTQPQYGPDPEILEMVDSFMSRSSWSPFKPNAMDLMVELSGETGEATLDLLNYDSQRELFLHLADVDPYETLNFSWLYIDKPFGMSVLQKAALDVPETVVEYIERYPDDPKYQKLHRFLIRRLGKEKIEKEMKRLRNSFIRRLVCGI
jgi:hypothetical protein